MLVKAILDKNRQVPTILKRFYLRLCKVASVFVKPPKGFSLISMDYRNQEAGIAAKLSGDDRLMEAYSSGDIYSWMAVEGGYMPRGEFQKSHPTERNIFKRLVLAVQYGASAESLATWIQRTEAEAESLLLWHRYKFHKFWKWQREVVSHALLTNKIETNYGWKYQIIDRLVERPKR